MQVERECILQNVAESTSWKKKMAVVSVLNRFKNKEMLAASGQESVVLAAEVEQLGNCLHRGVNFPKLSYLSCARQVVRVVHFCTVITSHCW